MIVFDNLLAFNLIFFMCKRTNLQLFFFNLIEILYNFTNKTYPFLITTHSYSCNQPQQLTYKQMFNHRNKNYSDQSFIQNDSSDHYDRTFLIKPNLISHSNQFSFKQVSQNHQQQSQRDDNLYKSESQLSLKRSLNDLSKQEIIEILLQEINSTQKIRNQQLNQTLSNTLICRRQDIKYKKQYQELVSGFEEYITNTNQVQQHYLNAIDQLKRQNKDLHFKLAGKISSNKQSSSSYMMVGQSSPFSSHIANTDKSMICKLQDTIQNYIQINNELISKVEKFQRMNKQLSLESQRLKKKYDSLEQQVDILEKNKEKLVKENTAYKSIVEQLKDYITQRRQAKQQADQSSDSLRSQQQSSQHYQHPHLHKNQSIKDNSTINNSQLNQYQNNDSTLILDNKQSKFYLQNRNYPSHQKEIYPIQQTNATTFRMMQIQNKQLKMTNLKLQQLLNGKGEKIRLLLEEIHTLREERIYMNEELIELKCKVKKIDHSANSDSTLASKCTVQQSKASVRSVYSNQINFGKFYRKQSPTEQRQIEPPCESSEQFKKRQQDQVQQKEEEQAIKQTKQNVYSQKVSMRIQRLLGKDYNLGQGDNRIDDMHKNDEERYNPKTLHLSNKKS